MRRPLLTSALTLLSIGGLLVLGMTPALAGAPNGEIQQTVRVVGNGSSVWIDHTHIQSGSIRFAVSTTNPQNQNGGGSTVSLFRLNPGVSVGRFKSDLADEFSQTPATAAKGTRELVRDVHVMGLADVVPGWPEVVTENVTPGMSDVNVLVAMVTL